MRAYELHGVNDLRREDIEKPEIPSGWVLVLSLIHISEPTRRS